MFALDHVHHEQWLSIYIWDLVMLKEKDSALYQNFIAGHFTVKKTNHKFSNIATYQAHEQNNKLVKVGGSAIGILDFPAALLKWSIAGSEIKLMLESLRNDTSDTNIHVSDSSVHHEDSKDFEKVFNADVDAFLISAVRSV